MAMRGRNTGFRYNLGWHGRGGIEDMKAKKSGSRLSSLAIPKVKGRVKTSKVMRNQCNTHHPA